MTPKFCYCEQCGNIVEMIHDSGAPLTCCEQKMKQLVPGSVDASLEKHVPVYNLIGSIVKVTVGSVEHPMVPEHFIGWIALKTNHGIQRKILSPANSPEATFTLNQGEHIESIFAYCNLHGLWKADVK
ncbi:desulfoferrodoxin family protein [Anaerovibrio sp.]|uniref:desulfoferrodoxin family protein n=1 Tax=Anaerovibrio sp. TaxID=1872532 RepID=UPI003F17F703